MMREVEESTETLLPAAERVLRELEEEARANWEERAIHQATQVTNLAGEAFETLGDKKKLGRRRGGSNTFTDSLNRKLS
jgi:hypothetical protein